GPKQREKVSWDSSSTTWSRKMRTECSSKAARTAEYAAGSDATSAMVTPLNSTPNPGPSGMVSIDDLSSLNLPPNDIRWQGSLRRRNEQTSVSHMPALRSLAEIAQAFSAVARYRTALPNSLAATTRGSGA